MQMYNLMHFDVPLKPLRPWWSLRTFPPPSKASSCPFSIAFLVHPWSSGRLWSPFCHHRLLAFPRVCYRCAYTVCAFLCFVFFHSTQWFWGSSISLFSRIAVLFLIAEWHPVADTCWQTFFQFWALMSVAVMTVHVWILVWMCVFISLLYLDDFSF